MRADERATGRSRRVRGDHRDRAGARRRARARRGRRPAPRARVALRRLPRRAADARAEPARRRWSTRRTSACWRATRASTRRGSSSPARTARWRCSWSSRSPGTELYELADDTLRDDPARPHLGRAAHPARGAGRAREARRQARADRRLDARASWRFDFASSSARFRQTAGDVAQLLAATAAIVGAERAVAAAVRRHGPRDDRRRAPDPAGAGAVGLDPRRLRRARPARRPPRRAPARSARRRPAPRRPSCAGCSGCSRAAC